MRIARLLLAMLASLALPALADDAPQLHELFQDHAVLQRGKPIVVWGTAAPRTQLTVTLSAAVVRAMADSDGRWTATLPVMTAGGPYRLTVESPQGKRVVEDVMIGDVWLCSGQSNMVLPVHRALDSRSEIAGSANDSIRMLTVPLRSGFAPAEHFGGNVAWLRAQPKTVPEFSATCYYFARERQKTVRVPMGLVNSSWGGSRIQAWMSDKAIRPLAGYADSVDLLAQYAKDPAKAKQRWAQQWQKWWQGRKAITEKQQPWNPSAQDSLWQAAPDSLGPWEKWGVASLARFDGMVWYRTAVELTAAQAGQRDAVLSLGRIDEVDHVWVNGRFIDTTSGADVSRSYSLPAGTLRAGRNVVVVNVLDTYGDGGMVGPSQDRALKFGDGSTLALDRNWQFQQVPAAVGSPPRAPWESIAGVTTIYNTMIAPLGPFGLRGVVWYQGESNTGDPDNYGSLLAALMADWRSRYGADLPFLIVQLANYGAPATAPAESGWAQMREAQRMTVAKDGNAALAVTVDIGDRYDIHPANKQEVGRRLARAARHLIDHESISASGPVAVSARTANGTVEVAFDGIEGELIAYAASRPIGFELCGEADGTCRFVDASIDRSKVVLSPRSGEAPTKVRYCWADSPVCTLYDRSTLPAGPFEIAIDPAHQ